MTKRLVAAALSIAAVTACASPVSEDEVSNDDVQVEEPTSEVSPNASCALGTISCSGTAAYKVCTATGWVIKQCAAGTKCRASGGSAGCYP